MPAMLGGPGSNWRPRLNSLAWWQRLGETQRAAAIVAGAALAAVLVYPPLWRGIANSRQRLADLHSNITEAQGFTAEESARARRLERAKQQLAPLARRVGHGQSMARVLETLNARAQAHQLQVVAVQPRAVAAHTAAGRLALREVPLELRVSGQYRQIGEFLGALTEAPFLADVREVSLSSPGDAETLEARIAIVVYMEEQS